MWYQANSFLPLQGKKTQPKQNKTAQKQTSCYPFRGKVVKADHMVTRVNRSFKNVFFNSEVMRGMKGQ